jgi:hypothetical protein
MREALPSGWAAAARAMCVIAAGLTALACGSSTDTFVAPTPTRCSVQAQTETTAFSATGGTGTVRISTNRECTWSVKSDASWVALQPQASGQGDGTIQFTVAANADPATRNAGVNINDQLIQLTQQGSPCRYQLSSSQETVEASGGQRTIHVQASSGQCTWTASADAAWIRIVSGETGKANGDVVFEVPPATGPTRTGAVIVAGQSVQVVQGNPCRVQLSSTQEAVDPAGGQRTIHVQSSDGSCVWAATTDAPWIRIISGATGSSNGDVVFEVAPGTGSTRNGVVTIAGQTVQVVQVAQAVNCTYATGVTSVTVSASGGITEVSVAAPAGCAWTAQSQSPWITIANGSSGSGAGIVRMSIAASDGPARNGSATIAGVPIAVTQTSGCAVTVDPASYSAPVAGSTSSVAIHTGAECSWTASANVPWITIASATSGAGDTQLRFAVAANTSPARSGALTIGGRTVTVSQPNGCTYSVTPSTMDVTYGAQTASASVTTGTGCVWTAATQAAWITLPQPSGSGSAQVQFTVAANNGPPRSGSLTIAGRTIGISQASPCTWVFAPPSHEFDANGGGGNVLVFVIGGCNWTAVSTVDWITVTAGMDGTGPLLQFSVAPNGGPARVGIVKVGGTDYRVSQAGR